MYTHGCTCDICSANKSTVQPRNKSAETRATTRLGHVFADLKGLLEPVTPKGERFIIICMDDFSREKPYICVSVRATRRRRFSPTVLARYGRQQQAPHRHCSVKLLRGDSRAVRLQSAASKTASCKRSQPGLSTPKQRGGTAVEVYGELCTVQDGQHGNSQGQRWQGCSRLVNTLGVGQ